MKSRLWAIVLVLCVTLIGCSATREPRSVPEPGFLAGDYSRLKEGTGSQPQLYYVNPNTNWKNYTQMLVDPVLIWRGANSDIKVSQTDAQHIANRFHQLLVSTLAQDYRIVKIPAPGTIRLRVALTDLKKTRVVLNTLSTIDPQARVASRLAGLVTGEPLFTVEVGMGFKALDAGTGTLMSAGVDERVGEKRIGDAWKTWEAIDDGLQYFADLLRYDFCVDRGGTNCVPPKSKKVL